jgi:hypothetical protein
VNAERASLFLVDHKAGELYARIFDVGTGADERVLLDADGHKEIRCVSVRPSRTEDEQILYGPWHSRSCGVHGTGVQYYQRVHGRTIQSVTV